MPRYSVQLLSLIILSVLVAGCQTAKKVEVRAYMQDKERIDQELSGKVGNWESAPDVVAPEVRKETRRIYVVEVSKEAEDGPYDDKVVTMESSNEPEKDAEYARENSVEQAEKVMASRPKIVLPPIVDDAPQTVSNIQGGKVSKIIEYRVEKDDTLQKISKKFYDSYSKWPKIYEANKAKIKNPDFLQPGIVIEIPIE